MATVQSGADTSLLTVDPVSKAARVTLYNSAGSEIIKQPLGSYMGPIHVRHTAATAANTTVWSMYNTLANGNTNVVKIKRIKLIRCFDGTAAAATTVRWAVRRTISGAVVGGVTTIPVKKRTTDPTAAVVFVRNLDTGLTTSGVTVESGDLLQFALPVSVTGAVCEDDIPFQSGLHAYSSIELAPGEGLVIRLATAAVIGAGIYGFVSWDEVAP